MTEQLLNLSGLSVERGNVGVVHDVGLEVAAGEVVAILGANGAGKSSLLRAIMGFEKTACADLSFKGKALTDLAPNERARLGIGLCAEDRRLFMGMTVRDTLEAACPGNARARAERSRELYDLFPQLAGKSDATAWTLSGGQQQMLALARALAAKPDLLLLDEPSFGLAPIVISDVARAVRAIADAGIGIILAEQNLPVALDIATRVVIMRRGRTEEITDPEILGDAKKLAALIL